MSPATPPAAASFHPTSRPGEPAWEVALLFPSQGQWTEAEYLALDTNRLVELSNGSLEVLPMPTIFHQLIVKFLHRALETFAARLGGGMVLFAPLPTRLGPGRFREPDIVYLRPERAVNLHGQPDGADLVMEVVSEEAENRHRDIEVKRAEYAAGSPSTGSSILSSGASRCWFSKAKATECTASLAPACKPHQFRLQVWRWMSTRSWQQEPPAVESCRPTSPPRAAAV